MRLREWVTAIAVTALVFAGGAPATAAGSDGPTPYTVTNDGITLPGGDTFPDGGHVNIATRDGNAGLHFEALNQPEDSPQSMYIGESFLPWSALGVDISSQCVTWVQISMYNEHYGEGGQPAVGACAPEPEDPPGDNGQCPDGYYKQAESYDGGISWTADKFYSSVILVGGPDNANNNDPDGRDKYFSDVASGATLARAAHDISHVCLQDGVEPQVEVCDAGTGELIMVPASMEDQYLPVGAPECADPEPPAPVTPPAPEWMDTCETVGTWSYSDTEMYTYTVGTGSITVAPVGDTVFAQDAITEWPTPAEDEGLECIPPPPPPPTPITPPAPEWMDTCETVGAWSYTDTDAYMYVESSGMITVVALGDTLFDPQAVTEWPTPAEDQGLECDDGSGGKKITFCHATGSDTNPYVTLTTSLAAFYQAGHINDDSNHSGLDIYPAGTFTHPTQGEISWPAQGDQSLLAYEDCAPPAVAIITAPTWVDECGDGNAMWVTTDGEGYTWELTAVLGGAYTATAVALDGYVFADGAQTQWVGYDSNEPCPPDVWICRFVEDQSDGGSYLPDGNGPTSVTSELLQNVAPDWMPEDGRWRFFVEGTDLAYLLDVDNGESSYGPEDCYQTAEVVVGDWEGTPECGVATYDVTATQTRFSYALLPVLDDGMIVSVSEKLIDTEVLAALVETWTLDEVIPCEDAIAEIEVAPPTCEDPSALTVTTVFATGPEVLDTEPGTYTVAFVAEDGHAFAGGTTERFVTYTVAAQLAAEECVPPPPPPPPPAEPTMTAELLPVCEDDVPYLDYGITLTDPDNTVTATTATLTFTRGSNSLAITVPRDSGRIVWPGYEETNGEATGWPGWAFDQDNDRWVEVGDANLGWTRRANVTVSVNPEVTQEVEYPPGADCLPPVTVAKETKVIPTATTPAPVKATAATAVVATVTYTG